MTTTSTITSVEAFFSGISSTYELLEQDGHRGKFHYQHRFYLQIEMLDSFNGIEENVVENMVVLRSAWVPPPYRKQGSFLENMGLLLQYAEGCGVAVMTVANPFELSKDGKSDSDFDRIFVNEEQFSYEINYADKKLRQRKRLEKLGFRPAYFEGVGNRNRIKKKDCLLFIPEGFSRELLGQIERFF